MVNCSDCIYDPMCGLASKMSKHTNIICNDFKASDKLREELANYLHIPNPEREISNECIGDFIQNIDAQPTVEHIRHAHWITSDSFIACSNCGIAIQNEYTPYANYCIFCGAKMSMEAEE